MKKINMYYNLRPKKIILGNDGNIEKRPYYKEIRRVKKKVKVNASNIIIKNDELTLDSKLWRDNKSNKNVRNKVFGYITNGIKEMWKRKNRYTTLIIDVATIRNQAGEFINSAIEVTNSKCFEIVSTNCCEGEQHMYKYVDMNYKESPKSLHIMEGGVDTDHYTYSMLHQIKNPQSKILVKLKHYGTIIEEEEVFTSATSYIIDMFKLNNELIKYCDEEKKFNAPMLFSVFWGILIGNDFVWSYDKNIEKDPRDPNKKYFLKSLIRGVNSMKLLNKAIELNMKFIKKGKTKSNKLKYVLNKDEFIILLTEIKSKEFTEEQIIHIKELLKRSEWCLNYFLNPADDEFLKTNRKRKRNVPLKKKKKRIKN